MSCVCNPGRASDEHNYLPLLCTHPGFPARLVYLYSVSCLRSTILVGNPRYEHLQFVCWFVSCLFNVPATRYGLPRGRTCSDNFTPCHSKTEVASRTRHLTQSRYTDNGSTSPSTDPITQGVWQGSHYSTSFKVGGLVRPGTAGPLPHSVWTGPLSRRGS